MSTRLSRPSSAASHSSRISHASHASYSSHASRTSHSGELKQECKAAYLAVVDDINDDITRKDDFISALQQTGRNPLQRIIRKYWDEDRESMSFDEFVDVCRREPATSEEDLIKAFRKIDLNGDGYISLDELYKIMTTKGEKMSRQEVKAMIDEVDENKDGKLDYKEVDDFDYIRFCHMLISTAEECKKLTVKAMERKERKKKRKEDGPTAAPRKDERKLSQASLRSAGRSGSRQSLLSIDDLPKPSPRGNKKTPTISRLPEPSRLRDWYHAKSKGCFFVDENKGFVSHQYRLTLTEDSSIWLTIQPLKIGDSSDRKLVDTAVYLLRDDENDDDALVTFTEQRDAKGCHGVRCDLTAGSYCLVPFTSGCRLKPRRSEPSREAKLVTKDKEGKILLTRQFKKALEEIFETADLDGNGFLSRDEFNWFNIRTSDDEVADDEWQVVEDNVDLELGEITKQGFIALNEMEAQDNNGDTEDLWITLNNMGFNKALEMDEGCPFLLNVYAEDGEAILKVTKLENPGEMLDNAICASAIAKGEATKVKAMKDLTMYTYVGDARASIIIENKSRTEVTMELDCRKSRNCVSNQGDLVTTVVVPRHRRKVGLHLLPEDERGEWSVRCTESILK